eukprot:6208715-Pleurochrysis_carterae.AAC.4
MLNIYKLICTCICEDDRTVPIRDPVRASAAGRMAPLSPQFSATATCGGTRQQALVLHVLLALQCASAYAPALSSLDFYRSPSSKGFFQPADLYRLGSKRVGHGLCNMHGASSDYDHALCSPLELQRRVDAFKNARVSRFGHVYAPILLKTCARGAVPAMRATAPKTDEEEQEEQASDIANQPASSEPDSKALLRFILPTLGTWLSSEVMSVVDTAVVGSISASDLAALGPATMLTDGTVQQGPRQHACMHVTECMLQKKREDSGSTLLLAHARTHNSLTLPPPPHPHTHDCSARIPHSLTPSPSCGCLCATHLDACKRAIARVRSRNEPVCIQVVLGQTNSTSTLPVVYTCSHAPQSSHEARSCAPCVIHLSVCLASFSSSQPPAIPQWSAFPPSDSSLPPPSGPPPGSPMQPESESTQCRLRADRRRSTSSSGSMWLRPTCSRPRWRAVTPTRPTRC